MKQDIENRLASMRVIMRRRGVEAVVIPQTDPHQSEYIASHWQVRRFLSGFSGSAGTLVITDKEALLWVDSRYFLQGEQQLEGTSIKLLKEGIDGTPTIMTYLLLNLKAGDKVGIDGLLFSIGKATEMKADLNAHGIELVTDFNVIDEIWTSRPALPKDPVFVHDEKIAGMGAELKLKQVLAQAAGAMAGSALVSALDEIAWILNIRSRDVKYNPVVTSYLYVSPKGSVLFVDPDKITPEISAYLKSKGVDTLPYKQVEEYLAALPEDEKVLVDEAHTSIRIADVLGGRAVKGFSPVAYAKACKNPVQIQGIRKAMERDGAALVRAFMEIERRLEGGERTTEMDVAAILLEERSKEENFFDESFGTIAGYAAHGAIVHYEADEESNAEIKPTGLLLVDSGAQYLDGTTDITRTIALGEPTEMEKHDFTLVMKGHIALDTMIFPVGTYGVQLDAEARKFLWREGLTYLHGTGHGVGHFLNVHEGPHQIRTNYIPAQLKEGMITSNEPGLYRENIHGIRCENLEICVKAFTTEFGEFLKFEPVTLFPFDRKLFQTSIMTDEEIKWVNDYHAEVSRKLSPLLDATQREWLNRKTEPIYREDN